MIGITLESGWNGATKVVKILIGGKEIMARIVCRICGEIVLPEEGRTSHLKREHNIAPYRGVVKDYFLHPWEVQAEKLIEEAQK